MTKPHTKGRIMAETTPPIVERLRNAGIWAVLACVATDAQRRAFVAGYNGLERPTPCSKTMARYYSRGQEASVLFNLTGQE